MRFPDGLVLQGTFSVHERYRAVHDFVADNLEFVLPFVLYAAGAGSQVSMQLLSDELTNCLVQYNVSHPLESRHFS